MSTLSLGAMQQVIREGGSVLHKGVLYTTLEKLPTEADLAVGDANATAAALAGLEAQQKILDDQKAKLLAASAPLKPATPTPAKTDDGLDSLNVAELHEKAKTASIEGQSTMNKSELIEALRKSK